MAPVLEATSAYDNDVPYIPYLASHVAEIRKFSIPLERLDTKKLDIDSLLNIGKASSLFYPPLTFN